MSQYYNPKRTRNLFDPVRHGLDNGDGGDSFSLSRSKIDLFLECPKCFYVDRRLGVGRPLGYPFNLNSAVDFLLKKEFDINRAGQTTHSLMKEYGIDAVPFKHEMMDEWRENFKGVRFYHKPTNLILSGAIDDVWINPKGELFVVDYKSTSKDGEVSLDADWQIAYKRQMEFYQWLLRMKGFVVSNIGYFVYCNGRTDKNAFDAKLEFDIKIIPYEGNDSWVEGTISDAHKCLMNNNIPEAGDGCDYCRYRGAIEDVEKLNKN